jgi:hypothetical protein
VNSRSLAGIFAQRFLKTVQVMQLRILPIILLLLAIGCRRDSENQSPIFPVTHQPSTMATIVVDSLTVCRSGAATISYNTTLGTPVNSRSVAETLEYDWVSRPFLRTRLKTADSTLYEIDYSPGPSCDPSFGIHRVGLRENRRLGGSMGTSLSVTGDGYIYISGIADDYFDRHRKYAVRGDTLVEIEQPSYDVGLASTVDDTVLLFREPSMVHQVATILPQDSIFVVLSLSSETYLIRDRHGILGWAAFPPDHRGRTAVPGLFYHGD